MHPHLSELCEIVIEQNIYAYPELSKKRDYIKKVISIEEERFEATIDAGLSILNALIDKANEDNTTLISGDDVFKLYDTYGFPLDLTKEIIAEKGLSLDEERFKDLMEQQRIRARNARADIGGWSESSKTLLSSLPKTEFTGYTENKSNAKVLAVIDGDNLLEEITEGEFSLVLDRTPFYGEGGGQVGDTGTIIIENAHINVSDTKKTEDVYIHICSISEGILKVGDTVTAEIDAQRREKIRRNHSAAHLLQAALRNVLGTHVEQSGSFVDETRLRFDFTHYAAMTQKEIAAVEDIVNTHILAGEDITTTVTDIETARNMGALALFGEKYGNTVRVIKMGKFSVELCGGTHLDNTAKAGLFKIISESSVAAGIRRIEATTGTGVLKLLSDRDSLIASTAAELKSGLGDIAKRANQLQGELKSAKKELETANEKLSNLELKAILESFVPVGTLRLIRAKLDMKVDALRSMCDKIKSDMPDAVALFAAVNNDKITFAAACGKDAVAAGANAGTLCRQVSALCGGSGGGRPDSAMSGGKDVAKLDEALDAAPGILQAMLN